MRATTMAIAVWLCYGRLLPICQAQHNVWKWCNYWMREEDRASIR